MSNVIIQEPSSQRGDGNVWIWRYADPVFTPVKLSIYRKNIDLTPVEIPNDYFVKFIVKADLRDESPVIEKVFYFDTPQMFIVNIPTSEVIQLRSGKVYHIGVALYDESGEFVRTIISDLPLKVEDSAFSKSVF